MEYINKMNLKFVSLSENESFARLAVASFCANQVKSIEILADIKTAVSEAVTNCIVHAYDYKNDGIVEIECILTENQVLIDVVDYGNGIKNIDEARMPFYTTKPDMERSGMGFTVMEGFMDNVLIESTIGKGTKITLIKNI